MRMHCIKKLLLGVCLMLAAAEEPTMAALEAPTPAPTHAASTTSTDTSTATPSAPVADTPAPSPSPTPAHTQAPSEAPVDTPTPTHAPTEPPTEPPATEPPTLAPTESSTASASTSTAAGAQKDTATFVPTADEADSQNATEAQVPYVVGCAEACSSTAFCKFPTGNCAQNVTGSCIAHPKTCSGFIVQVCGCDGKTYPSECHASKAGVNVDYTGVCEVDEFDQNPSSPAAYLSVGFAWLLLSSVLFCVVTAVALQ